MRSSGPLSERNEKCHNNHSCEDASLAFNDSLNYSYAVDAERASERASEKRFVSSTPSAESKQGAMNFPGSQTK